MKVEINLIKEDTIHENDISAQEKTAREGTWIQIQNEHKGRQKGSFRTQAQRQKADRCLNEECRRVMLISA